METIGWAPVSYSVMELISMTEDLIPKCRIRQGSALLTFSYKMPPEILVTDELSSITEDLPEGI